MAFFKRKKRPTAAYMDTLGLYSSPSGGMSTVAFDNWKQAFIKAGGEAHAQMLVDMDLLKQEIAKTPESPISFLHPVFPVLGKQVMCPPCSGSDAYIAYAHSVADIIIHLNDVHRWSREQIASWLETLNLDLRVQPANKGD